MGVCVEKGMEENVNMAQMPYVRINMDCVEKGANVS